jgi:MFS-type transporter involved in bile tolerance (Atg22 family)
VTDLLTFIKRNLRFSEFTGVNLLSKIGDRLFYTAMLTLASGLPQASIAVTIVSISETLPVLLGFALGSIADQQSHKFMKMIQNTLIRAVLYIAIGFALNYSKTLQLFLIMAILNFISDVLGNYSSALSAPFTKLLVNQEDMEQAQGLVSTTAQAVNVLATFCGSLLLSLFVANKIAYLNAGVFIIVAILYTILRPRFKNVDVARHAIPASIRHIISA